MTAMSERSVRAGQGLCAWWSRLSESNRRPIHYEPADPTSADVAQVRKPLVTGPTRTSADTGGQPATETRSETTTTIAAPRLHPHADEPGGRSSADGYE